MKILLILISCFFVFCESTPTDTKPADTFMSLTVKVENASFSALSNVIVTIVTYDQDGNERDLFSTTNSSGMCTFGDINTKYQCTLFCYIKDSSNRFLYQDPNLTYFWPASYSGRMLVHTINY